MGTGTGAAAWLLTNYLLLPTSWAQYETIYCAAAPAARFWIGGGPFLIGTFRAALPRKTPTASGFLADLPYLMLGSVLHHLDRRVCAVVLLLSGMGVCLANERKRLHWWRPEVSLAGLVPSRDFAAKPKVRAEVSLSPGKTVSGWLLKIAPALFVMLLATGLAVITNALLAATGEISKSWWDHDHLLEHTTWS